MVDLFTYGTLMYDPVWRSIVSGHYEFVQAELCGYQRFAVKGEDYPVIKPGAANASVTGVLYFGVSGKDLIALDAFEGTYYQRIGVTLNTEKSTVQAQAYVLRPRYYCLASAKPWDTARFEQQGLARFLRLTGGLADNGED
jgi:AIG2-like family.